MELNKELQSLIERASNLHDRINEEIKNSVSFCSYCSQHGYFCKVTETPFEERERLIACRDSLKEVQDMLIYIQRLQAWQLINRQAALNQLEESRLILTEKVSEYQGRPLDVIKELNKCFGNGRTGFDWNLKIEPSDPNEKRQTNSFLLCCFRFICSPGGWHKAVVAAAKLIAISITVSSTVHFCRTRQQICSSNGKAESMLISSKSHPNVLKGKG